MAEAQFPGNSNKSKEPTPERPRLEKVVEGEVKEVKVTFGDKMKNVFFGNAAKGVLVFVGTTVIIPMLKDLASQGSQALVDGILYGEDARNRSVGSRIKNDRTPYNRMHGRDRIVEPDRSVASRSRATHDFSSYLLETRAEGQMVLERLTDQIGEYGHATVADLYDLLGVSSEFTDAKWGWTDLRGSDVRHSNGGYILIMPKTEAIN